MTNLHEKLNREAEHIRLSHAEKNAMRAAIFGAPSPLHIKPRTQSPYLFLSSGWMRALAALVVVITAGSGTAFASEGALPGQPLYAIKTHIVEPVKVALATTPTAKAAVHAQIAQERVAEAEALAQSGTLDATTSAQLADNFDAHAQAALALANAASTTDPAAATEVKAQLAVSSSVGSAVLVALADDHGDRDHAASIAARVLAIATDVGSEDNHGDRASKAAPVRAAAVRTIATVPNDEASGTEPAPAAKAAITAAVNFDQQKAATELQGKAQLALSTLKAQFAQASSTLNATTTVSVQTSIAGIEALIGSGTQALNDGISDTAVQDFTQALSKSLRLSALLSAQQKFDHKAIETLIKNDSDGGQDGSSGRDGDSRGGSDVRMTL